jgi:hypothetical protein
VYTERHSGTHWIQVALYLLSNAVVGVYI